MYLLFLLGQMLLLFLFIQQFWTKFECHWKLFLKSLAIHFNLLGVSIFKCTKSLGIFLLCLKKIFVPLLIKLMILFDVCLFTFLALLLLIEY